jgi:hypothetical protein
MNREFFHFGIFYKYRLKLVMKYDRNMYLYTLKVTFQVLVTF